MSPYDIENEKRIFMIATVFGIASITVSFKGDHGLGKSMLVYLNDAKGRPLTALLETPITAFVPNFPYITQDLPNDPWRGTEDIQKSILLRKAIENLVNRNINDLATSLYDGEGGFGTWEWNVDTGRVVFEAYARVVQIDLVGKTTRQLGQPTHTAGYV